MQHKNTKPQDNETSLQGATVPPASGHRFSRLKYLRVINVWRLITDGFLHFTFQVLHGIFLISTMFITLSTRALLPSHPKAYLLQ